MMKNNAYLHKSVVSPADSDFKRSSDVSQFFSIVASSKNVAMYCGKFVGEINEFFI